MEPPSGLVRWVMGLSARILILTLCFVMAIEVLVFVPSLANFWRDFLNQRLEASHIAAIARDAAMDNMVSPELESELLQIAGVRVVALKQQGIRQLIFSDGQPVSIDSRYDLRKATLVDRMMGTFATLGRGGEGTMQVTGQSQRMPGEFIEVILDESALYDAMLGFARNIFLLSIFISVLTAVLVYLSLHFSIVRPMRKISDAIVRFREDPEHPGAVMQSWHRRDEIGVAQCELARMQEEVREALSERSRLASLGAAVARINHDLRNILANLQLASDGLTRSEDPKVQVITPRIMRAVDRGIRLCQDTLTYGKASEPPPMKRKVLIGTLVEEVAMLLGFQDLPAVNWVNEIDPDLCVPVDADQMFRVFHNLLRNGLQAIENRGELSASSRTENGFAIISIRDDGPGVPDQFKVDLFKPFMRSTKADGSGLGLAIAAELARAHGGHIELAYSDSSGSVFDVYLPLDKNS